MDFGFGYIKSPPPSSSWKLELLMENLDILCGLQICLHKVAPPQPKNVCGDYDGLVKQANKRKLFCSAENIDI